MLNAVYFIPAFPLLGFLLLCVGGARLKDPWAGWLATLMAGGSALASILLFFGLQAQEDREVGAQTRFVFDWIPALDVDVAFNVDPLSVAMVLFVTAVGSLIHLYSIGYMHGDERFHRFFVYLNLFLFSMLMLVLGDSFLVLFLGWEGVGACSYLLVSFWFEKAAPPPAGKKAFLANRVGDVGLMIAMFLMFASVGSLAFDDVLAFEFSPFTATAIVVCVFIGCAGKSAQIPLYLWLPDAMEGPTPVSALIHAATMVTAGVYLLCRISPITAQAYDWAPEMVAWIGVLTALYAATVACAQNDIKRVLAYSTISQLGYMFLAVGLGAYTAGVFHMVTHAFFKGLLFLGAGAVIHALHDEQDMKRMGGLLRYMPITAGTFIIGWLAIAGVPGLSGFWSKDDILLAAWHNNRALWLVGTVTAVLTAYYMTRQVRLAFFGDERWREASDPVLTGARLATADEAGEPARTDARPGPLETAAPEPDPQAADPHGADPHGADPQGADPQGADPQGADPQGADPQGADPQGADPQGADPHDPPWTMSLPLVLLAGGALVGGVLNLPFGHRFELLGHWLEPAVTALPGASHSTADRFALLVVAGLAALVGIGIGMRLWAKTADQPRLEPGVLRHAWYVDRTVSRLVGGPGRRLAQLCAQFDQRVIDGLFVGSAGLVRQLGLRLRGLQTGYVRNYALGVAAGAALLLGYALAVG